MRAVDQSYEYCRHVARSRAKNFYYSFLLLSAQQRKAMCAIYAFMRYCDDLSDDETVEDRACAIARWRDDLHSALAGRAPEHALWPAFTDAVTRYRWLFLWPQFLLWNFPAISAVAKFARVLKSRPK